MVGYSSVKAHKRKRAFNSLMDPIVNRKFSADPSGTSGVSNCTSRILDFSSSVGIIVVSIFCNKHNYTSNAKHRNVQNNKLQTKIIII